MTLTKETWLAIWGIPEAEAEAAWARKQAFRPSIGPRIWSREIYDYRSPIDGEHVTSRLQHHNHMKKHDVIEMGNELPKPPVEKPFDWKSAIGETYAEMKVVGKIDD